MPTENTSSALHSDRYRKHRAGVKTHLNAISAQLDQLAQDLQRVLENKDAERPTTTSRKQ